MAGWKNPKGYYVYTYLDHHGTPYYVGMGKGRRAVEKHKYVDVPPLEYIIIEDRLTQEEAWNKETILIEQYGMACKGDGPLLNLQKGGKTQKSGWNHSEDTKRRISESLAGKKKTSTINYRKPKSKEHAEAIRQANLGREDDGRNAKISASIAKLRWYNNGEINKRMNPNNVTSGWIPGMIRYK